MCGLAGIVGLPSAQADRWLSAMVAAQRHRGPDGEGRLWVEDGALRVGLGHRRLAVQDLGASAHQPMRSTRSGDLLVYNGELYNTAALRAELRLAGCVFAGHGDTEVLLAALETWGEAALPRLRGMYAFAWWQSRARTLWLARDPLGIKPLYVHRAGDTLLFASEVRALRASGCAGRALDPAGLAGLLAYGALQAPATPFADIGVFPAGCVQGFHIDGQGRLLADPPRRHWSFPSPDPTLSRDEVYVRLRATLDEAVRSHLVGDVPVAVCLSSGIDSTVVAALAARARADLQAFTVGFGDSGEHSEVRMAADTARGLGIEHRVLTLHEEDAREQVLPWLQALDQPCLDGLNTFVLARALRAAGIVVALSGQGGDELFGGYPSFVDVPAMMRTLGRIRSVPPPIRRELGRWLALGRGAAAAGKLADAFAGDADAIALTLQRRRCFADAQIAQLLGDTAELREQSRRLYLTDGAMPAFSAGLRADTVAAVSAAECWGYLGHTLLPAGDHGGMAHGLEIRVPMLDRALLDLVLRLPGRVRLPARSADKALLRATFAAELPRAVTGHAKRGFVLPLSRWMRGELRTVCEAALASLQSQPWITPGSVEPLWQAYLRAPSSPAWSRVWLLVTLGHWLAAQDAPQPCRSNP